MVGSAVGDEQAMNRVALTPHLKVTGTATLWLFKCRGSSEGKTAGWLQLGG